jgi:hypothetical protein
MKKVCFITILLIGVSMSYAQEQKTNSFTSGIGISIGMTTENSSLLNGCLFLEGDYMSEKHFSMYGSIGYNRLFSFNEKGSAGFASAYIGPRLHFSEKVFLGAGIGYAFATSGNSSGGAFTYYPHLGLAMKKTQLTLGYIGLTDNGDNTGIISLGIMVKFHKKS